MPTRARASCYYAQRGGEIGADSPVVDSLEVPTIRSKVRMSKLTSKNHTRS